MGGLYLYAAIKIIIVVIKQLCGDSKIRLLEYPCSYFWSRALRAASYTVEPPNKDTIGLGELKHPY